MHFQVLLVHLSQQKNRLFFPDKQNTVQINLYKLMKAFRFPLISLQLSYTKQYYKSTIIMQDEKEKTVYDQTIRSDLNTKVVVCITLPLLFSLLQRSYVIHLQQCRNKHYFISEYSSAINCAAYSACCSVSMFLNQKGGLLEPDSLPSTSSKVVCIFLNISRACSLDT